MTRLRVSTSNGWQLVAFGMHMQVLAEKKASTFINVRGQDVDSGYRISGHAELVTISSSITCSYKAGLCNYSPYA